MNSAENQIIFKRKDFEIARDFEIEKVKSNRNQVKLKEVRLRLK